MSSSSVMVVMVDSEALDGHGKTWVGRRKGKIPLSKSRKAMGSEMAMVITDRMSENCNHNPTNQRKALLCFAT